MNDDYSPRSDRDGRSGSNLLVWLLLVTTLAVLVLVFLWQHSSEQIDITDLHRLVEATKLNEKHELLPDSTGSVDVYGSKPEDGFLRYSGLTAVSMGKTELKGKAKKEFFKPDETGELKLQGEAREIVFRTTLNEAEKWGKLFEDTVLRKAGR